MSGGTNFYIYIFKAISMLSISYYYLLFIYLFITASVKYLIQKLMLLLFKKKCYLGYTILERNRTLQFIHTKHTP